MPTPLRMPASTAALTLALLALAAPLSAASAGPSAELAAVYQAAGLQARDGSLFREGCDTAFSADTEYLDLDRDGQAEVLLYLQPSRCFAGGGGGNVALLMKDEAGRWVERFGFAPGVEVVPQATSHGGLPDLGVANPGGCMTLYHWTGQAYAAASQKAIEPGGCQLRE